MILGPAFYRSLTLVGLLVAQVLAISFTVDAQALSKLESVWFSPLAYSSTALKFLVVACAATLIGIGPKLATHVETLNSVHAKTNWLIIAVQLVAFICFYAISSVLFIEHPVSPPSSWLPIGWLASGFLTGAVLVLAIAPPGYWLNFLKANGLVIFGACLVSVPIVALSLSANYLWAPLGDATFAICAQMLGMIYDNIQVEPVGFILGTQNFLVSIGAPCSGYEGIALVVAFTTFYLSSYRREFRFPQALVLIPIGALLIWVLNTVRITLLIVIGEEFSPEVAVGGFHSQAGWIFFVLASSLLLIAFNSWRYIRRDPSRTSHPLVNSTTALIIPLVVLLAFTLLTNAFSAGFNWFYPARVLATGAALILLWKYYKLDIEFTNWSAITAGVGVFIVWVLLVEPDAEFNTVFADSLLSIPTAYAAIWLAVRVMGSVITVPLAEELAFRGYLMQRLGGHDQDNPEPLQFSWFAWLVSSVAFGLLHGAWIAGIFAGMVYGWVRYRRDKIADAVLAHATTNLLLFFYASTTGQWSIW